MTAARRLALVSLLLALISLFLALAAPIPLSAAPAPPSAPCSAPECHQFDFWIGRWDVFDPLGHVAGTNEITSILGGCVLHEHWNGAKGGSGQSFNVYDASRGLWHQTWVDAQGGLLVLEGGWRDGRMVLTGDRASRAGPHAPVRNRITWTPLARDTVRQYWDASSDSGRTWTVQFDGRYVRRP